MGSYEYCFYPNLCIYQVGFTPLYFNETAHRPSNASVTGNDSAIILVVDGAHIKLITGAAAQASWVGPR